MSGNLVLIVQIWLEPKGALMRVYAVKRIQPGFVRLDLTYRNQVEYLPRMVAFDKNRLLNEMPLTLKPGFGVIQKPGFDFAGADQDSSIFMARIAPEKGSNQVSSGLI